MLKKEAETGRREARNIRVVAPGGAAMASCEMVHVEKDTVGDGAAERGELLVKLLHGVGETVRQICLADVAEGGPVGNDASLKEDSGGVAGAKTS